MNFLELCQKVASESGITTTGPSTVTGQVGILSKVILWVKQADMDVQLKRDDWNFLWGTTQGELVIDQREYFSSDFGADDINVINLALINGEEVGVLTWSDYVDLYKKTGLHLTKSIKPTAITRAPNGKFHVFPVPTTACFIEIDYYADPQYMVNDLDVSAISAKHHEIIVQKALMSYSENEEDDNRYNTARANYLNWLNIMGGDAKPKLKFQ